MSALVSPANDKCGPLTQGRKYGLGISDVLGGKYDGDELAIASQVEPGRISGDIAGQIGELPQGAQVRPKVVE
ncbi:hypothetical protein GPA19_24340 [Azoarcus indigens]|nr:hypothetical protein [Azoarcus indigens]